jgi:anti-sigma factor RsiW
MSHLSDDELVLHYYDDHDEPDRAREHLETCQRCREELEALRSDLDALRDADVPERDEDYGARVYRDLEGRLGTARRWSLRPAWALIAAAVLLAGTFLAGRFSARWSEPASPAPGAVRERVLLVALGDHLRESQVLLLEIANGGVVQASGLDRARAEELVAEGRLYRQTALSVGDVATAEVLEELERLLLDVAHGPGSEEAFDGLRSRIEDRDMLFKLRVLQTSVAEKAPRRF